MYHIVSALILFASMSTHASGSTLSMNCLSIPTNAEIDVLPNEKLLLRRHLNTAGNRVAYRTWMSLLENDFSNQTQLIGSSDPRHGAHFKVQIDKQRNLLHVKSTRTNSLVNFIVADFNGTIVDTHGGYSCSGVVRGCRTETAYFNDGSWKTIFGRLTSSHYWYDDGDGNKENLIGAKLTTGTYVSAVARNYTDGNTRLSFFDFDGDLVAEGMSRPKWNYIYSIESKNFEMLGMKSNSSVGNDDYYLFKHGDFKAHIEFPQHTLGWTEGIPRSIVETDQDDVIVVFDSLRLLKFDRSGELIGETLLFTEEERSPAYRETELRPAHLGHRPSFSVSRNHGADGPETFFVSNDLRLLARVKGVSSCLAVPQGFQCLSSDGLVAFDLAGQQTARQPMNIVAPGKFIGSTDDFAVAQSGIEFLIFDLDGKMIGRVTDGAQIEKTSFGDSLLALSDRKGRLAVVRAGKSEHGESCDDLDIRLTEN